MSNDNLNWKSRELTDGENIGIQAFYYGLGWDQDDFQKPQIGIGTPLHEINLCNMHSHEIGESIKEGLEGSDMHGFRFGVPSVSDNITQGHGGGNASLPSRNVIATSTEMVTTSHRFDGFIGLHHCDKNGPGFALALVRTNLPGFILSGGTIKPGCLNGEDLTIQHVYDEQAKVEVGSSTPEKLLAVVKNACPGAGGCGIAASFNTWGLAMEAIGLMPPFSSSNPAEGEEKRDECRQTGEWMKSILLSGKRPKDIVTKAALRNATAMIGASGGSTNGILHLMALAAEAGVDFGLRDVQAILRDIPVYCNFAPRGRGTMIDLFKMGGTPMLIKHFIEMGVLDGSVPTLFAESLADQVKDAPVVPEGNDLIAPAGQPYKSFADMQICFGSLAPDGIVFKVSSRADPVFEGTAICFNDVPSLVQAVTDNKIQPGHVVVLRGMGPVAMGMPEVLVATSALSTPELDGKVAFVSDTRVSGVSHGAIGVHCAPEAAVGGPIAFVQDDEPIRIDLLKGEIDWQGKPEGKPGGDFKPYDGPRVYLREFASSVAQADHGCVNKSLITN
ncbi:dihydroxy-acid dehydratase [Opitutia bacterium ISCC 51]|nr:dihydroxy-acid dehydratase [Opitutae bacterium ISCC 51]QXD29697.1 dihydroxy-acid dehydratase [Opitutae bacterium ISCC 52]